MKLFKYVNYTVTISEEALLLKPFRIIWTRDRSSQKERALQELGAIYFSTDPRSDYMFIIDPEERMNKIIEQEGMKSTWKPDKVVEEGLKLYEYLSQTTSSLLLQDTRMAIDKLRQRLRELDLSEVDEKGKPIYTLQSYTATIKQIPELSKSLIEAEKAISKELEDTTRMRGQGVKKLFEDGLSE